MLKHVLGALPLMATIAGCADAAPGTAAAAVPDMASAPSIVEAPESPSQPAQAEAAPAISSTNNQAPMMAAAGQAAPAQAPELPKAASAPPKTERVAVTELSDRVLATWGSSVCDGYSVPSGTGWPWLLEKKLAEIHGPKVLHASTSGHTTDSKESALERAKVESADFVVVCLSLGNQGLGNATSEANAQSVVDTYVDDIFTDESDSDGDPVSMVSYIKAQRAQPIVTLVYPMAGYNKLHCQHVVESNIQQQALGVPTINLLGPTNAGKCIRRRRLHMGQSPDQCRKRRAPSESARAR